MVRSVGVGSTMTRSRSRVCETQPVSPKLVRAIRVNRNSLIAFMLAFRWLTVLVQGQLISFWVNIAVNVAPRNGDLP